MRFTRPDGTVIGPISMPDGTVVAQGDRARSGRTWRNLPKQRATLRDEIKSQKARDRNSLFGEGIRQVLIKQGKIKVHEEVIKRLIAQLQRIELSG